MRKSRVLLAGVAVAAAAAATSAFTASNTLPSTGNVLGSGQVTVSGAVVNDINYVPLAADTTLLDKIEFTSTTDVSLQTVTMSLKNGVTPKGVYTCTKGAFVTDMVISCVTPDNPVISGFDTVGLTVAG
jgi:hypothetical protein